MGDRPPSRDGRRRYLIATGVTRDLPRTHATLTASVDLMADLFTNIFGYQRVTGLGIDPSAEQLRAQLRDFCESCGPEDVVAYYHTGHAETGQRGHRLRTGGDGNYYVTSMPTDELAELMLEGTPLRRALIILDTCFAGQGGAEILLSGLKAANRSSDKTLTVVTAAHPAEQVRAGDFAALFEQAVKHPSTAGHEPTYRGRPIAITAGDDHRICIWELPRGRLLRTFSPLRSYPVMKLRQITSIDLAELGSRRLVAITRDTAGIVRVWNVRNWRVLAALKDTRAATLHSCCVRIDDQRLLVVNADDDASVRLWLITSGRGGRCDSRLLDRIDLESRILGLRVAPDHTLIVSTSRGMAALKLQPGLLRPVSTAGGQRVGQRGVPGRR